MNTARIASCAAMLFVMATACGASAQTATCGKNHYILDYGVSPSQPGNLNVPRSFHTATLLDDGRVVITGGTSTSDITLDSAELYDPATGTWTVTGRLMRPRIFHTATLLPSGKVLVVGGDLGSEAAGTAELYDPATGIWTATGNLNTPRSAFTATLLATGEVLIAGGVDDSDQTLTSAELYDPATETWSYTADLIAGRFLHTATLLQDGRVLVAGGWIDDFYQFTTPAVEIYDPMAGTWSRAPNLAQARVFHTATILRDGKVLVAGGYRSDPPGGYGVYVPTSFAQTELFDPVTGTWSIAGNLNAARDGHTATLLADGRVLVVGGADWNIRQGVDSTELYEPLTATWSNIQSVGSGRRGHTATRLRDGDVLIVGGKRWSTYGEFSLSSVELYASHVCQ